MDCEYAIIGGGIAGLSMAIALQELGKDFLLYERSQTLTAVGAGFGLAANAMQAFELLDLLEEVEPLGFYTESFDIYDAAGRILVSPDTNALSDRYQKKNFTIHRADLQEYLKTKIPQERIILGKRSKKLRPITNGSEVLFDDGTSVRCRYVIVAEGIKSAIRQQLLPGSVPRYAGYTCWRATIPQGNIALPRGSETWGAAGRFGMTPLTKDRIYWYACVNAALEDPRMSQYTVHDLQERFRHYHAPIPAILNATSDSQLIWNDIIDIRPINHFAFGNIVLIGDAAHATTPNMGQGACQALEDVVVLKEELSSVNAVEQAFVAFEKRRLERTRYIIETSRRIGWLAQWEHPTAIAIRDFGMRMIPSQWAQMPLKKLLRTDFMDINIGK